jgi:hypothetical protein
VATDRDDRRLAAPGDLELVRDFVNTLDVLPGTDELDDPASLASWLIEHRLVATLPTLTDEDLARARSLREALRALLLANAGFPLVPESAECQWVLYDHTKNYSAAWCGSQCGARVRARRHRKRRLKDSA